MREAVEKGGESNSGRVDTSFETETLTAVDCSTGIRLLHHLLCFLHFTINLLTPQWLA